MAEPRYSISDTRYWLDVSEDGDAWYPIPMAQSLTVDEPSSTPTTENTFGGGAVTGVTPAGNPTMDVEVLDAPVAVIDLFRKNKNKPLQFRERVDAGIDVTFAAPNAALIAVPDSTKNYGKLGWGIATFDDVSGAPDFENSHSEGLVLRFGTGGKDPTNPNGDFVIQYVDRSGADPVVYVSKVDHTAAVAFPNAKSAFKILDPQRQGPAFGATVLSSGGLSLATGSFMKKTFSMQLLGSQVPRREIVY